MTSALRTTPIHNPRHMGAIPGEGMTSFRVWSPFAEAISVVGEFNNWDASANPMTRDGEHWHTDVAGAKAGQQYQFEIRNGDVILRKNDPYAREIHDEKKTSVIHQSSYQWRHPEFELPTLNNLVIYELHVGTFAPDKEGEPGRFAGVRKRLPYLKNLGVNVIEIMPPAAFPSDRSWGYNLTNPFAVEGSYGGPDGMRALVDAAHDYGIGVIVDVVYNHFGPDNLDLWQFDGWNQNNLGGIYFYNDQRSWTPWGENRPDYGRGEVRQYIRDNALMWFEDFHVDGLRWDATSFIRDVRGNSYDAATEIPAGWSLMQWVNEEISRHFPNKITIAEDLACNAWITHDTGAGGAGFGAQWDAAFVHPIRHGVTTLDDSDRNMAGVGGALTQNYNGNAFSRVIYSESHDEVANGKARVTTEIAPEDPAGYFAKKRSILAAGLVLTAPGIPMLFEGQEFLEDGWFRDDVALDWDKLEAYQGITRLYRDLIQLRKNKTQTTRGLTGAGLNLFQVNQADKVIAFHRFQDGGAGDDVIVVANFSNAIHERYRIGFPRQGTWKARLNSDWKGYSPEFAEGVPPVIEVGTIDESWDGLPYCGHLALAPYAFVILSQDANI